MQVGKLRHRLKLERLQEARDVHGGVSRSFSPFITVWGQVEPLTGRELMDAQQVESQITHRVRIRHNRDLVPSQRVSHKGRIFQIQSVINRDERRKETLAMCTEVV